MDYVRPKNGLREAGLKGIRTRLLSRVYRTRAPTANNAGISPGILNGGASPDNRNLHAALQVRARRLREAEMVAHHGYAPCSTV